MSIRQHARQTVVQALYQWHFDKTDVKELILNHLSDKKSNSIDVDFFRQTLLGVVENVNTLDDEIVIAAGRPIEEITPIELAILRLGAYEIRHRIDVPYKVSITEATSLAHRFGPDESYRFVNRVLDLIAESSK
ncbi:MAG: transcription antitermination factor NusB [Pseudomonadota bacterium]|nr:transcription antitermination factor NusB [Pseudomonadota bacterium]